MFRRASDGSMVGGASWLLRSSLRIGVRSVIAASRSGVEKAGYCECEEEVSFPMQRIATGPNQYNASTGGWCWGRP
jgi:hypothetical protein